MNLSNSILIDKVEIIEKTDYFTLSINQKKNRLYLYYTSKPIFFVEEISEYIPAFEKALSRLQPGFSVLSDKRYCLPYCRAVADEIARTQEMSQEKGLGNVAIIFPESPLRQIPSLYSLQKTGISYKSFLSFREAEEWLDSNSDLS
ncbi:MAG: hypothetical protein H7A25_13505 [Leptospiraceae bacterium]|nr:hypothetical protein [Leptospiraceae bacterium]MCP5500918.1 hypothetical protein [Leptospiraceae bacterium]